MAEKKKMKYETRLKLIMLIIMFLLINTYTTIFYFVSRRSHVKNGITQCQLESGFAMSSVWAAVDADKCYIQTIAQDVQVKAALKNPESQGNINAAYNQLDIISPYTTGKSLLMYSNKNEMFYPSPTHKAYPMTPEKLESATKTMNLPVPYTLEVHPNGAGENYMWIEGPVKDDGKVIGFVGTGAPVVNYVARVLSAMDEDSHVLLTDTKYNIINARDETLLNKGTTIRQVFGDSLEKKLDAAIQGLANKPNAVIVDSTGVYVVSLVPLINFVVLAYQPIALRDIFTGRANASVWAILILICLIDTGIYLVLTKFNNIREVESKLGDHLLEETQNLVVTTKETAATSQDQSAAVKEIVATMEDSNALSENISQKIKDVSDVAMKTTSDVGDGAAALVTNVQKLHEIFEANQQTINGIKTLGDKIENIWDIVTLINSVADQAKIIAFNAELEAASAGEAGKNFHIVASEIRRLADSIIDGTKEIKEKINEIQQSSDSLILASESGTVKINEGCDAANELEDKFNSIRSAAEITANSATEITDIIQQQTVGSGQILITLKQIAAGVENFTAATENISASAQNLKGIASDLTKSVNTTGKKDDGATPTPAV